MAMMVTARKRGDGREVMMVVLWLDGAGEEECFFRKQGKSQSAGVTHVGEEERCVKSRRNLIALLFKWPTLTIK